MKKLNLFFLLAAFMALQSVYAQIESFTYDAYKDYDKGVRVAYFYIEGIKDIKQEKFVQNELRKNLDVTKFYLYKKEHNLNRCMIETKSTMDEKKLEILINNIIIKYKRPQIFE